ncbi:hypothetical protein JMUB6875_34330 [Nocardia sp. JMUB6875]|uniref:hypothetical protein n=1 Tax=Nocardia sp. JMUB6875 TaxID=3158170 RepID=UPI0032E54C82
MNQPQQPYGVPGPLPQTALEVTVTAGSETAKQLSRTLALARWRSPATWGFLLAIPLIVLSRRFIEFFVSASKPGFSFAGLLGYYVVVLGIAAVIGALLTAVQMVKRNPAIEAYAGPGTAISARFHQDSLELVLATGTTAIAYSQIKDTFVIGDGVFLREQGARGIALPHELFTPAALELIEGRPGVAVAAARSTLPVTESTVPMSVSESPAVAPQAPESAEPTAKAATPPDGDRKLIAIAIVGAVALAAVGAYVASHSSSDSDATAATSESTATTARTQSVPLPNPCALTADQMQRFGITRQVVNDAPGQRRCEVDTDRASSRSYVSARIFVRTDPKAEELPPRPVRVGDANGQEYLWVNPKNNYDVVCYVAWPTSFGFVRSELNGYNANGVNSDQLCRDAEELANQLYLSLPR